MINKIGGVVKKEKKIVYNRDIEFEGMVIKREK
jgi:hypothetical protein